VPEEIVGIPPGVVPPAVEVAGGVEAESVGEAGAVPVGVLSVGDAAGDEDVGNGETDAEADADGEAGTVPDGLVCGDGDAVALADAVAEGAEQCVAEDVGNGIGIENAPAPLPAL
jgi:hypothetical protein